MEKEIKKIEINNIINHSFFDDIGKSNQIWSNFLSKDEENINNKTILLKDYFFKKKGKTNEFQKRFYILTEDSLFYKKEENSSKIVKIMYFDYIRLELMNKNLNFLEHNHGFKFIKTNHFSEIYTNETDIFNKWRKILYLKCTLSNFHDDFEVRKLIGKGSFAKVYLAVKNEDKKEYAIKAFNKEFLLAQSKGKESLLNEINIMRKMNHKNILKIYEVYETRHSLYLVLDILKGGELIKRIKEKGFYNELEIAKVMYNFLQALQHLHENHVMHRDLKPENILLTEADNFTDIIIADFGLASFLNIDQSEVLFKRCGTPGFVAPEILSFKEGQDEFYNEKCDIFSAGVIFYLLLTGKKPFSGHDCKEVLKNNRNCQIDFTLPIFSSLNENAVDLLKKMLIVFPQTRITAKKALQHVYFEILKQENEENQKISVQTEANVSLGSYSYSIGDYSKESLGSLSLCTRKPILNGRVDTIEKISQNNINSNLNFDPPNYISPKLKQTSKFSQKAKKQSEEEEKK